MALDDLLGVDPNSKEFQDAQEDVQEYAHLIASLVALRKRSLTQKEVAEIMGTTQSAISKFESASGDARYSTIQHYARSIGVRVRTRCLLDGGRQVASFNARAISSENVYYRHQVS